MIHLRLKVFKVTHTDGFTSRTNLDVLETQCTNSILDLIFSLSSALKSILSPKVYSVTKETFASCIFYAKYMQ